jgi:hypothetical protein
MFSFGASHQTPSQNEYAASLFAHVHDAVILRWAEVEIGEWRPEASDCHANVTELCAHDPTYSPVRGWLYFDFGGYLDRVQFLAHSAVPRARWHPVRRHPVAGITAVPVSFRKLARP